MMMSDRVMVSFRRMMRMVGPVVGVLFRLCLFLLVVHMVLLRMFRFLAAVDAARSRFFHWALAWMVI